MSEANGAGPRPATLTTVELLPNHLEDLRRSGLTDAQIKAARIGSANVPRQIAEALGWKGGAEILGPCLCFPYFKATGEFAKYVRLKPDSPRKDKEGRVIKYEAPVGRPNHAYFPPATRGFLFDSATPLLLTEGEKKALRADQDGFPCVGLSGVEAWSVKRKSGGRRSGEPPTLIEDLRALPWRNREVYVAFDSDAADNRNVLRAEVALSMALAAHGADVRVVRLPPGPPGPDGKPAKVGLDDYLLTHTADDLRGLMALAERPQLPPATEAGDDPHRLAREFRQRLFCHPDGSRLVCWQDSIWEWDCYWRPVPDPEMKARINAFCDHTLKEDNRLANAGRKPDEEPKPARRVTTSLVNDVFGAIKAQVLLTQDITRPEWLG